MIGHEKACIKSNRIVCIFGKNILQIVERSLQNSSDAVTFYF